MNKSSAFSVNSRSFPLPSPATEFLSETPDDSWNQLFDPSVWMEPLAKFAKATGLTVILYDGLLERRCGFTTASPIAERLTKAGFWLKGGLGTSVDRAAAFECFERGKPIFSAQLSMFSHLAIPLFIDGKVLAVFVLGWLPDRFADPVICDALSKKIGAAPMEIWQLIRMQQPISREKIESHAHMLETFAVPLIRQLKVQIEDRRRAQRSRIVSETAVAFAKATTENEICAAAIRSLQMLVPATGISIHILKARNETEEVTSYDKAWLPRSLPSSTTSTQRSHLTIPIPAVQGRPLGSIEITLENPVISEDAINDIQTVAGQFGIALQKVHLIHALESERSALKGANVQLQHMHKMKDEFLATISHELRTPLNAILGWSHILLEEGPTSGDFTNALSTIERNAKNQSHLIEDLLDVSRIISGKMTLKREDIEATSLLHQSIETVFPMTEGRRQKLHLQISSSPIQLKGDATRLTQIFWNLLSNASKFTPEGGDISVLLENAGHYFRLEISDSGKGISPEFLPHLFDRFSQADGSFTRRHGGLGLGLAIVRHLVELHGGTVTAKSEGEGKGSTFTVFLPQNTTDVELDNAQSLTRFSENGMKEPLKLEGVKVLLVDDEPDSLRLSRFVLEKCGAVVQMADAAEQGYQMLKEWRPDVLISDISMPGESGHDLILRVRFLGPDDGGLTPAIALTALAGREQRDLAINAGFQLHLEKPLEPNLLTDSVASLLQRSLAKTRESH